MKTLLLLASLLTTSIFAGELQAPRVRLNLKNQDFRTEAGRYVYRLKNQREYTTCARRRYSSYYKRYMCVSGYVYKPRRVREYIPASTYLATILDLSTSNESDSQSIRSFMLDEKPENCLINSMQRLSDFANQDEVKDIVADLKNTLDLSEIIINFDYTIRPDLHSPVRKNVLRELKIIGLDEDSNENTIIVQRMGMENYTENECQNGMVRSMHLDSVLDAMIQKNTETNEEIQRENNAEDLLEDFSELETETQIEIQQA